MKRKKSRPKNRRRGWTIQVFNSFEEADEAERQYWRSKTPAERMEALERIRGIAWGYESNAKARPRFQRIIEFVEFERR